MKDEQLQEFFDAGPVSSSAFAEFFKLPGIPIGFSAPKFRSRALGSNRSRNDWVYEQLFLKLGSAECSGVISLYELIKAPRLYGGGLQGYPFIRPFWESAQKWIIDYVSFRASRLNSENERIVFIYSLAAFFEEFEKSCGTLLGKTTVSYSIGLSVDYGRSDNFCSFSDLQNYCDVMEKRLAKISPTRLQHYLEEIEKRPPSLAYLMVRLFRKSFQMCSARLDENSSELFGNSIFQKINTIPVNELLQMVDLTTRGMDLGLEGLSYDSLVDIIGESEIRGLRRRK